MSHLQGLQITKFKKGWKIRTNKSTYAMSRFGLVLHFKNKDDIDPHYHDTDFIPQSSKLHQKIKLIVEELGVVSKLKDYPGEDIPTRIYTDNKREGYIYN